MKPIGVFYATREGHTQRIARHVAVTLRAKGVESDLRNLRAESISLDHCCGAILLGSLHGGRYESELVKFARQHSAELQRIPSAFVPVCLSQAAAERPGVTPQQRERAARDVRNTIDRFLLATGWRPERVKPVAGALAYSKYNFLLRLIMKQIARKAGGDTDTSRDYEYTNWEDLDRFVTEFAAAMSETPRVA